MNKKYIFSPLFVGIGALLWISASGGVAHVQQKDRTGSPVSDVACTQCHVSTGNFSSSGSIQLETANGVAVTEYIPGEAYVLKVVIQSTGNVGHGFQVTGLLADNSGAGTCNASATNLQISPLNGRWYFESDGFISGGAYEMVWTAPSAGSGGVTFYGNGISTNGNGTTGGDEFMSLSNLSITEGLANGLLEAHSLDVKLYPNPVNSVLNVQSDKIVDEIFIFDNLGKLVKKSAVNGKVNTLDVANLAVGSYFIHLKSGEKIAKSSFIKE